MALGLSSVSIDFDPGASGGWTTVATGSAESPPNPPIEPGYRYRITLWVSIPGSVRQWAEDRMRQAIGAVVAGASVWVTESAVIVEWDT